MLPPHDSWMGGRHEYILLTSDLYSTVDASGRNTRPDGPRPASPQRCWCRRKARDQTERHLHLPLRRPAQHDSFDLKPDAPDEIRGEFKPIATQDARHPHLRAPADARRSAADVGAGALADAPDQRPLARPPLMLTGRSELPPGFNPNKPQPTDWPSHRRRRRRASRGAEQPAAGRRAAGPASSTTPGASSPASSPA